LQQLLPKNLYLGEERLKGARAVAYWVLSALVVASGLVALIP